MGRLQVIMRWRVQTAMGNLYHKELKNGMLGQLIKFNDVLMMAFFYRYIDNSNIRYCIHTMDLVQIIVNLPMHMYLSRKIYIEIHCDIFWTQHVLSAYSIRILVIPIKSLQIRNEEPILFSIQITLYSNNNNNHVCSFNSYTIKMR